MHGPLGSRLRSSSRDRALLTLVRTAAKPLRRTSPRPLQTHNIVRGAKPASTPPRHRMNGSAGVRGRRASVLHDRLAMMADPAPVREPNL
ncbi:hypothetical protein NDU88_002285 [Pleurodeles waltl]|uniref:Uncharacterized protein n=1 Tax=Pleurodeles waltl TaxID=8319 RepID=A0AAV7U990_PLEWA|nr:hypothetical protein NDU88_002285 [Pleurodeles waltl]